MRGRTNESVSVRQSKDPQAHMVPSAALVKDVSL